MANKKIHILLIGPVTNVEANLVGGATISFGYLVDYLKRNGDDYNVINTQRFPLGLSRVLNPFYVLLKVILYLFKTDVLFLNSSRGGTKFLAPVLFVLAKGFGKKFVFRPFGGDIKDYTAKYSSFQNWIFKSSVLKADIFFLQTKELIAYYAEYKANIIQLPTSREKPEDHLLRRNRPFQKRFIFIGFINEAKGIDQILAAADQLGDQFTIDIYGPIKQEKYHGSFEKSKHYKGVLNKDEVLKTLQSYDVLILPTYYEGEGYPGVIIEAYSVGVPVISTDWKAIPEIIEDGSTGKVIAPKSSSKLVAAMTSFDKHNYSEYSKNARAYFLENFDSETVSGGVISEIKSLF